MNKLQNVGVYFFIYLMAITMITSTSIAVIVYASPTTEDDGYTYPDDASDEEKEEIDEQEQEAWEDAGRPGQDNNSNNDDDENGNNDDENASWNESCRDAGERAGENGNAFSAATYDHCGEEVGGETAYLQGFVDGCKTQKNANDEYCQLETDRSSVWGDNPPTKQSLAPGGSSSSDRGSNELVLPYSTPSEQSAGSSGESNELPKIDSTPASVMRAPAIDNNGINETRWYNNCEGGGKQAGGWLQFDTFSYQTCESHANGDKAYYDGFVQGCMGIDDGNTKQLCEAFIVGCLRAQTVDSGESCDVAMDTSSAEWKIVMVLPAYQDSV